MNNLKPEMIKLKTITFIFFIAIGVTNISAQNADCFDQTYIKSTMKKATHWQLNN